MILLLLELQEQYLLQISRREPLVEADLEPQEVDPLPLAELRLGERLRLHLVMLQEVRLVPRPYLLLCYLQNIEWYQVLRHLIALRLSE